MGTLWRGLLGGLALVVLGSGIASAIPFDVHALTHSSNIVGGIVTGTPLGTGLFFDSGDAFTASAAIDDLWRAGDDVGGVRESNADGLTGIPPYGGHNFGSPVGDGFAAPFGALVGRLGTTYFLMGTSYSSGPLVLSGPAELELYYWDTFTGDNSGFVTVDIEPIPEPGTLLLLGSGITSLALRRRRRKA